MTTYLLIYLLIGTIAAAFAAGYYLRRWYPDRPDMLSSALAFWLIGWPVGILFLIGKRMGDK